MIVDPRRARVLDGARPLRWPAGRPLQRLSSGRRSPDHRKCPDGRRHPRRPPPDGGRCTTRSYRQVTRVELRSCAHDSAATTPRAVSSRAPRLQVARGVHDGLRVPDVIRTTSPAGGVRPGSRAAGTRADDRRAGAGREEGVRRPGADAGRQHGLPAASRATRCWSGSPRPATEVGRPGGSSRELLDRATARARRPPRVRSSRTRRRPPHQFRLGARPAGSVMGRRQATGHKITP